jgi:hypothetical protein
MCTGANARHPHILLLLTCCMVLLTTAASWKCVVCSHEVAGGGWLWAIIK